MTLSNSLSPQFGEETSGLPGSRLAFDSYRQWRERNGRALRVLHLGNIANNAFNNARIQRQYGVDAYVIAYENYHIMACPEWEEATFQGSIEDPFFPDWSKVDLGGYQRPNWFASGPLDLCCSMVAAEIAGDHARAVRSRRALARARQLACSRTAFGRAMRIFGKVRRGLLRSIAALDPDHARLVSIWKRAKGAGFQPRSGDFAGYRSRVAPLSRLFDHFDIIQAYSIDGAWPLLARRTYLAYEHGTLRVMPFEDDATGRLAATVYLAADHVFVTNIDCVAAARKLGISSDRITPLPHAFDDRKVEEFRRANSEIRPPEDRIVLFHPARQDWLDADPSLVKGNDRLLRAFASVSAVDPRLRLIMVAWGRDVNASRDLVRSLGIEDKVQWLEPMRKPDLWRMYLSSHAVLDQFILPSFGGITFEALALGRRVITNVDIAAASEFFSEAPPVFSASTDAEIVDAIQQVLDDPQDLRGVGEASGVWIRRYHSAERIVSLQLSAYSELIGSMADGLSTHRGPPDSRRGPEAA